jgi:hypothetical protein
MGASAMRKKLNGPCWKTFERTFRWGKFLKVNVDFY